MKREAYLILLFTMFLDQLSKYIMLDLVGIASRPPMEVTPFFNLVMVWNHGVSFGMFANPGTDMVYFLIGVALVISVILLIWLQKTQKRLEAISIGLIVGGALGNVIDRFRFGAVADFFDVHVSGYHWPAFNIADSAIFIGVMFLLFDGVWASRKPCKGND